MLFNCEEEARVATLLLASALGWAALRKWWGNSAR
jgi:hypothetical protein